jgi:hypothetical protein
MTWDTLCGGKLVDGKPINLQTLIGVNVDHDKRGKTGLPTAVALGNMVAKANSLKIKKVVGKGIAFTVAEGTIDKDAVNAKELYKEFLNEKRGASVCYEDTFLPLPNAINGHVLVHQSMAPCKRCRAGYKAWAEKLSTTIIVAADAGYDGAPANSTFIFSPTGLVFYG